MTETVPMKIIARIRTDFSEKFGIPRQSGLVEQLKGRIVFEEEYRNPDALRGLEDYSHIWLLWQFSEAMRQEWSPTVRPPRLGGNTRMGVFATRSPFRPNAVGLSCVRLERIELHTPEGPVIHVAGADLLDGSPIYDLKPYLPYADAHPEASSGFVQQEMMEKLRLDFPAELLQNIPAEKQTALCEVLRQDPRPGYQTESSRSYGMKFAGFNVRFFVQDGVMRVFSVEKD